MSDPIKHECGIGMIRLLKPLDYFIEKYGTPLWGLNKLYLLMEKQHNRGQDAFGIGCVKLNMPVGNSFMMRERSVANNPIEDAFKNISTEYNSLKQAGKFKQNTGFSYKENFAFAGELYLGHLRYGTHGENSIHVAHPVVRRNNWITKNIMLAGNFNMTNTPALIKRLMEFGQHPTRNTDTMTILEQIGYCVDEAYDKLRRELQSDSLNGLELTEEISNQINLLNILKDASKQWDGGYVFGGFTGSGDSFVMRDPNGIRPCSYIQTDEYVAIASERVALMTAFDSDIDSVQNLPPGHAITINRKGKMQIDQVMQPRTKAHCSFERIYFSRPNDPEIYTERKKLGQAIVPQILKSINNDLENAVFGFIPNSAEIAYLGMIEALEDKCKEITKNKILEAQKQGELTPEQIDKFLSLKPRAEKVAIKDVKMRTFISQSDGRKDLVSHVYDITYGIIKPTDTLICIDDSIVRGTTMRESILRILSRLNPKKIIIISSAPQIRYPDCYGIDMSRMTEFIAFEATIALLQENNQSALIDEVYKLCVEQAQLPDNKLHNYVSRLYKEFSPQTVSDKITEMLTPTNINWKGSIEIIYQSIEGLHKAIPEHSGDWYFTGNYPTPGGYRVLNTAFINYYEKNDKRSY